MCSPEVRVKERVPQPGACELQEIDFCYSMGVLMLLHHRHYQDPAMLPTDPYTVDTTRTLQCCQQILTLSSLPGPCSAANRSLHCRHYQDPAVLPADPYTVVTTRTLQCYQQILTLSTLPGPCSAANRSLHCRH